MVEQLRMLAKQVSRTKFNSTFELSDLDSLALVGFCALLEHTLSIQLDINKIVDMKFFEEVDAYLQSIK